MIEKLTPKMDWIEAILEKFQSTNIVGWGINYKNTFLQLGTSFQFDDFSSV